MFRWKKRNKYSQVSLGGACLRTALKCGIEPDKQPALSRRSEEAMCDEMEISDDRLITPKV